MNTKLLMTASALLMAILGISASFLPKELLTFLGMSSPGIASLLMQVGGALYLGFAMMNWMAKANLIGGIYSRPITMANFTHFTVGALALVKGILVDPAVMTLWLVGGIYCIFAIWFALVAFYHPVQENTTLKKV
jgi:hypothetical protein